MVAVQADLPLEQYVPELIPCGTMLTINSYSNIFNTGEEKLM